MDADWREHDLALNVTRPQAGGTRDTHGSSRLMGLDDQPFKFKPGPGKFYRTDAFTDFAVRWIDECARKAGPHFLYLASLASARLAGRHRQVSREVRMSVGRAALERHGGGQIAMGLVQRKWPFAPLAKLDPRAPGAWTQPLSSTDILRSLCEPSHPAVRFFAAIKFEQSQEPSPTWKSQSGSRWQRQLPLTRGSVRGLFHGRPARSACDGRPNIKI